MSDSKMAFDIRGEGSEALEIDVYDVIGESWDGRGMSAKKMRGILRNNAQAKKITMRVNSGGGSVIDGFAIYQLLVDHKAEVTAEIDGLAASMASVIIMAADEISIAPHAMVMIHNPWGLGIGDAEEMRKTAELLDKMRDGIADAYVSRTGIERDEVIAMMDAETWMNAEEAQSRGFVDIIKDAKKKDGDKALARLDLSPFSRVPAGFVQAVAQAKSERPQAAQIAEYTMEVDTAPLANAVEEATKRIQALNESSTAAVGGAPNKENKMDLKELKAQHPDLFDAAVQEGVKQERGRVNAHLKLGQTCGDISIAVKAIADGVGLTEELQAEYMSVGMKNAASSARQAESDGAASAVDRHLDTEPADGAEEAAIKAMAEKTMALLGRKVG